MFTPNVMMEPSIPGATRGLFPARPGMRLLSGQAPGLLPELSSYAGFGFAANNHVDSVLEALVGYQVHKNIRIYGGYGGLYFSGSGSTRGIAAHGWFHGPMLGSVFSFWRWAHHQG